MAPQNLSEFGWNYRFLRSYNQTKIHKYPCFIYITMILHVPHLSLISSLHSSPCHNQKTIITNQLNGLDTAKQRMSPTIFLVKFVAVTSSRKGTKVSISTISRDPPLSISFFSSSLIVINEIIQISVWTVNNTMRTNLCWLSGSQWACSNETSTYQ